jgi:hypothetical protein
VEATVQDRGRPTAPFEDVFKYFSDNASTDRLKSQVITHREGSAVHIIAGKQGTKQDLQLFRWNLRSTEDLIDLFSGESSDILADKGHLGQIDL